MYFVIYQGPAAYPAWVINLLLWIERREQGACCARVDNLLQHSSFLRPGHRRRHGCLPERWQADTQPGIERAFLSCRDTLSSRWPGMFALN
jgi:hypothetical protein